eukprot:CAMPEP_0178403622 /NCGR_PEP_ID=MMETSP0689_2-20121128/17464_1 /TAXON_ID=160604 /ORGANISM="Amphidinium massartii, Strain CS-259" /LENGTH=138 /DNA_ID=CAMNT_0020024583 /DNA_START=256 /DNA_END=672 /DNA_ORIENTATION=+
MTRSSFGVLPSATTPTSLQARTNSPFLMFLKSFRRDPPAKLLLRLDLASLPGYEGGECSRTGGECSLTLGFMYAPLSRSLAAGLLVTLFFAAPTARRPPSEAARGATLSGNWVSASFRPTIFRGSADLLRKSRGPLQA